jgi:hypothetical protein
VPADLTEIAILARVVGWRRRVMPQEATQTERLERAGLLVVSIDATGVSWASATRQGAELVEGRTAAEIRRVAVTKGRRGQASLQQARRFKERKGEDSGSNDRSENRSGGD